jgi:hypothetical protein
MIELIMYFGIGFLVCPCSVYCSFRPCMAAPDAAAVVVGAVAVSDAVAAEVAVAAPAVAAAGAAAVPDAVAVEVAVAAPAVAGAGAAVVSDAVAAEVAVGPAAAAVFSPSPDHFAAPALPRRAFRAVRRKLIQALQPPRSLLPESALLRSTSDSDFGWCR